MLSHILGRQRFYQKVEEELPQLCVCNINIEASSLPLIAIHTTLATPLPHFDKISAYPVCETAFWVAFIIFLRGLMRLIIISETRESIFRVVKLSQIFLFHHYYEKIADLASSKRRFVTKQGKKVCTNNCLPKLSLHFLLH